MKRLLAISLAALGGLELLASAQTPPQDAFQISVNVDLVVLQATVHDKKGGFAPNLKEPDFQIYEDGAKQSIRLFRHEDIPVTVGLVVDHSGSMHPKLAHVVQAARTFVRASNPRDQMFVVNFNDRVTLGLPGAEPFTDRPEELEAAISKTPATGQTRLYDAVVQALERLRTGTYAKKVLVVISDGGDNASVLKLPEVLKKAEESSAAIYTIGIFEDEDPDRNPDVLRRLARATGGEAFFPRKLEDVVANCENIARDIRHQYTLGYAPAAAAKPGVFRSIRVVAATQGSGKLLVRARAGYIR
jgi:Ca-activated chloride channel homolog